MLHSTKAIDYLNSPFRASWHLLSGHDLNALAALEEKIWSNWPTPHPFKRQVDIDHSDHWIELYADIQRLSLFEDLPEMLIFRITPQIIKTHYESLNVLAKKLITVEKPACFIVCSSVNEKFLKQWSQLFQEQSFVWLSANHFVSSKNSGIDQSFNDDAELMAILKWIRSCKKNTMAQAQHLAVDLSRGQKIPQLRLIRIVQKTLLRYLSSSVDSTSLNIHEKVLDALLQWELRIKTTGLEYSVIELEHQLQLMSFWLSHIQR